MSIVKSLRTIAEECEEREDHFGCKGGIVSYQRLPGKMKQFGIVIDAGDWRVDETAKRAVLLEGEESPAMVSLSCLKSVWPRVRVLLEEAIEICERAEATRAREEEWIRKNMTLDEQRADDFAERLEKRRRMGMDVLSTMRGRGRSGQHRALWICRDLTRLVLNEEGVSRESWDKLTRQGCLAWLEKYGDSEAITRQEFVTVLDRVTVSR